MDDGKLTTRQAVVQFAQACVVSLENLDGAAEPHALLERGGGGHRVREELLRVVGGAAAVEHCARGAEPPEITHIQ